MEHHHHHHHEHEHLVNNVSAAFIAGIVLNMLFVIIQVIAGWHIRSLSLLSDAGHNFADAGGLAISLLAFRLLKVKSTKEYTYGYKKVSVLTSLLNACILLVSIGAILVEAIRRLLEPTPTNGLTISIVSAIGIVINTVSALFFLRDKDHELNAKGAYLHLLGDAAVSLSLVAGGIIIYYTRWYWMDSALSIAVAIAILVSTWQLLRDSLRLSLDGVPTDIHVDEVKNAVAKIPGILDFHHIHIWALSTTENALTAHLVLPSTVSQEEEREIRRQLKDVLARQNIRHITIETELGENCCDEKNC